MSRNKDYQRLLNSPRWAKVKAIVRDRAGGLCERCKEEGFITPGIDCHHVIPVESGKTLAEMERLCYDWKTNIRLLCVPCHIKTHAEQRSHSKEAHKQRENDRLSQWIARQGRPKDGTDPTETPGA
jgi:5-methylcytosine-specific restriction endonuclease McrA